MPVSISVKYKRDRPPRGMEPLTPQRKWRAITLATLVLVPAFWSMLAGFVAAASDDEAGGPGSRPGDRARPRAHPVRVHRPRLHVRAPASTGRGREGDGASRSSSGSRSSAIAGDAVTGLVAGVGAGGIVALRADDDARRGGPALVALAAAAFYTFVLVRIGGRDHAALGADLPVHEHRDRRPLLRAAGASGQATRAIERRLPRDVRLGCRDVGVPDRRRRRSRRARRRRSGTRSARRRGKVHGGEDGRVAADHRRRMADDVALLADIGVDAYRFSIAWPRVQPDGRGATSESGVDFYRALVDALLAAGIEPVGDAVPLGPAASARGPRWLAVTRDRPALRRLRRVSSATRSAIACRRWSTINEPWCAAMLGYGAGVHAPGRIDAAAAIAASHHLLLAHGLAVDALRATVARRTPKSRSP